MADYVQYEHHGALVSVREDLKGKHREYCLCWSCANFKPGEESNCPRAKQLYQFCVENDMVTPVWECPAFKKQ